LHGFDLKSERAIIDAMQHHADIAMRLEARGVACHVAGAKLQIVADAAHIGFDRQAVCTGKVGKIIKPCARDLHRTLPDRALRAHALSDQRAINAYDPKPTNPQTFGAAFEQSADPRGRAMVRRHETRDHDEIGSAKPEHGHIGSDSAPASAGRRRHALTKHSDLTMADRFDRPGHFADHVDAARGERAIRLAHRDDARDLSDLQPFRGRGFAVDAHGNVGRVGDARVIDEDAAEALDDADNTGAADAMIVAAADAGAANALIATSPDLRPDRGRTGEPEARQQQTARDERRPAHDGLS
jgi:hypothetical protein